MFKRILLSLVTIALVSSSAYAGTRALLSDSASLTTNTFSVGSVDLKIARDDTSYEETVQGFTASNLLPGQESRHNFWLQNNSSGAMAITGQGDTFVGDLNSDKVLITVNRIDNNTGAQLGVEVAQQTLTDWFAAPKAFTDNLGAGVGQRYELVVKIDPSLDVSGQSAGFNLNFVGTQVLP